MVGVKHKYLLWIAAFVQIAAFQLWNVPTFSSNYGFPVNLYFLGTSVSFFILGLFIFFNFKKYLVSFIFFGLTVNNLIDELFFDPTKMQLNELFFTVLIVTFGIWRYKPFKDTFSRTDNGIREDVTNANPNNGSGSNKVNSRK